MSMSAPSPAQVAELLRISPNDPFVGLLSAAAERAIAEEEQLALSELKSTLLARLDDLQASQMAVGMLRLAVVGDILVAVRARIEGSDSAPRQSVLFELADVWGKFEVGARLGYDLVSDAEGRAASETRKMAAALLICTNQLVGGCQSFLLRLQSEGRDGQKLAGLKGELTRLVRLESGAGKAVDTAPLEAAEGIISEYIGIS
ncbi:MAG: hypothetical protein KDD44_11550 [Bdellovibrionales bacterium]|nr:hypothetical protein [Bdellovibrionales bacterium]